MDKITEIFDQFRTGFKFRSFKELKTGHINQSFLITTDSGKQLFLQKVNEGVFKDPIKLAHNFNILSLYVKPWIEKESPYSFPKFYYAHKYLPFLEDEQGGYWRLMDYIENTHSFSMSSKPSIAYEAATAYGIFQKALLIPSKDAFYTTITSFRNLNMRIRSLKSAIKRDIKKRKKSANAEINAIIRLENINTDNHALIKSGKIKKLITHNDTKLDNILFDKNSLKAKAVVDYDTIQPGYLIYDFGDMVRSFCNPVEEDISDLKKIHINTDMLAAVLEGFAGEIGDLVSQADKESLSLGVKVIIYMQAIRFLTDYLNGDIYYKTDDPEQNLKRCRNQLKLLENYIQQEAEIQKIIKKYLQ
ncbi:MAG: aminoglycoside phosphotransferase family protein [Bacteroidales bacterium]|nr:aminoglycoside phosphotransferase family protein [Bacteroidales bacterium]MCF8387317.1 aminoglycoside phosphotransferase family protein [Bacteroidales bacterium]MCF8397971.1 aminoglycoside phosphotransferase family protein [Bacteroidales bacterium]